MKKRVGVLGATGNVGFEVIEALLDHPWVEISHLFASERSVGREYKDVCKLGEASVPEKVAHMVVEDIKNLKTEDLDIIFSALPAEEERKIGPKLAKELPVMSTTSAFRYENDVPILITEVNSDHAELLRIQQKEGGWEGFIAPGPNCTTINPSVTLKPLYSTVGIKRVFLSSYQAVSGAGYEALKKWEEQREKELPKPYPVTEIIENPDLTFEGNVIGYIKDEEPKVRRETLKILGKYENRRITPADFLIDPFCVRVPTYRGHLTAIFVKPIEPCSAEDVKSIYAEFNEQCEKLYGDLPSSPKQTIVVLDRAPQPRWDVNLENGMAVIVGRIEISNGWIKYLALSDNLRKGAAKGVVQDMEYLLREAYIK